MSNFSEELFLSTPVVGILRGYQKQVVLEIAKYFHKAGFANLEITMNTPNALNSIAALSGEFEGKLNIGAGTVLSCTEVDQVIEAGGQFIVSPVVDSEVIKYCRERSIPIFPGAFSPTEIYQAWQLGARMVKVFPAGGLGPQYIRDVLAPLDNLELMPTGGVTLENISDYLEAGAKAFGMGGNLFKQDLIEAENWSVLSEHFRLFKDLVH